MLKISTVLFCWAACVAAFAQDEKNAASGFRQEKEAFKADCTAPAGKILSCLQELVTGKPLHLGFGSMPPQNGFGFGLAFGREYNLPSLTTNLNLEALASTNGSWLAGLNFKAVRKPTQAVKTVSHRPAKGHLKVVEIELEPEFNLYAEAVSLNKLDYYGLGQGTSRSSLAFYGMRQVIVGGNVNYPLKNSGVALFGELNGRFVELRGRHGDTSPSIEQLYSTATAPGLGVSNAYIQPGGGVKFDRDLSGYFILNYSAGFQEFGGISHSEYSFQRLNFDFTHTIPLYNVKKSSQPGGKPARNREGSIGLEAKLIESFAGSGHTVPFYFQPTLGGADINGDKMIASYADYRFRAPNLMLFRGSFEHVLWGPLGGMILADTGRVGLTRGDLGFQHLVHSYAAGLTIRAGGFPMVQLLFAWGGHEGTHTIATINPALVGGGSRPPLY